MLLRLSFFIFLLISSFAFSSNENAFYALSKNWNTAYVPLACSDNMIKLFKELKSPSDARILHIFDKHVPHVSIQAKKQRLSFKNKVYKPSPWTFHAVLILNDEVLDLDYTDTPSPVSTETYFKTMWNQDDLQERYRFQIKPASEYSSYDTDGTMNGIEIIKYPELIQRLNL